jgi:hypothetical protein
LEFILSKSDDPRLIRIRGYLRTVNSLSFEAIPDYASLSSVLSKINEPITKVVDKIKASTFLKFPDEAAKQTIIEVIGSKKL